MLIMQHYIQYSSVAYLSRVHNDSYNFSRVTTMWIIGTFLLFQFGRLLERSDMSVIFVFMLAYTVATISQCFMFSVLFSKANVAAACAGIFYFIGYLPFSLCLHWQQYMSATQKGLAVRISHVFSPVTALHARHFSH